MTDRELLELAAKAYWSGEIDDVVSVEWDDDGQSIIYTHASNQDHNGNDIELLWNPLIDDGDALRLMAKLQIEIGFEPHFGGHNVVVANRGWWWPEKGDIYASTRRAIVLAAAEIGKAMQ